MNLLSKEPIQLYLDAVNLRYWYQNQTEDMMNGKYCKRVDSWVHKEWDCQGCQLCTESTR